MKGFRLASRCVFREDEGMVFDAERYVVHRLNETGKVIVSSIATEPKTLDALSVLLPDYPRSDVEEFLSAAQIAGFVSIS